MHWCFLLRKQSNMVRHEEKNETVFKYINYEIVFVCQWNKFCLFFLTIIWYTWRRWPDINCHKMEKKEQCWLSSLCFPVSIEVNPPSWINIKIGQVNVPEEWWALSNTVLMFGDVQLFIYWFYKRYLLWTNFPNGTVYSARCGHQLRHWIVHWEVLIPIENGTSWVNKRDE